VGKDEGQGRRRVWG